MHYRVLQHVLSTTVYRLSWDTPRSLFRLHRCQRACFHRRDHCLLHSYLQISWFTTPELQCLSCEVNISARGSIPLRKREPFGRYEAKTAAVLSKHIYVRPLKNLPFTGLNLFLLTGSAMIFQSVSRVARVIEVFAGCQEIGRMNHPDLMRSIKLLHILHTTCCAKKKKSL